MATVVKWIPQLFNSNGVNQAGAGLKTDLETGQPCLSVRDHHVIVGTVAREVFRNLPNSLKSLVSTGGITLCALHDIGKISPGFLMKSVHWRKIWQKCLNLLAPDQYEQSHNIFGHYFLARLSAKPQNWLIGGHHGI